MKCWVNILGWAELISLLTAAKITTTFFRSAAAHGGGRVPPVARLLSNFTYPGVHVDFLVLCSFGPTFLFTLRRLGLLPP